MDCSVYLIKLFGSYFLLIALFFSFLYKKMAEAVQSILKDEALTRALGLLNIFFGLALFIPYMEVYQDMRIALQVIALLMIATGTARLLFYTKYKSFITKTFTKKTRIFYLIVLYVVALLFLALSCC